MRVCLKELRETHVWLQLANRLDLLEDKELEDAVHETNELIAIFVASIKTAGMNAARRGTSSSD
jgi:four helix bundle protein